MAIARNPQGRLASQIRPLTLEAGVTRYAEGSVLVRAGHTHVLCNATIEESVPGWLIGKGKGWVTAEYSMLPRATHTRGKREREKVSGRTHEIQRLIGRALRTMVDLKAIGERSIIVDCDVIQADGGTRTAAITGGCVALALALHRLKEKNLIQTNPWVDTVAAVSIGKRGDQILADLDYDEDSTCDVDMNFVVTGKGHFVEIQGTAERDPFSREDMNRMTDAAMVAIAQIREVQSAAFRQLGITIGV